MINPMKKLEIIKNGAKIADIGGEEIIIILKKVIQKLKLPLLVEIEWKEK